MKKDWKYILYLSLAFGVYLIVQLSSPKSFDWTPTYASEDKNPFGAYALKQLLPEIFKGKKISVSNQTIYELKDSLKADENILILTHHFNMKEEDSKVLLEHAARGASVFIAAQSYYGTLADTLNINTYDYLFRNSIYEQRGDTSFVKFVNRNLDTARHYIFKRDNIHNYFGTFDSTRTSVIAENDFHQPVALRVVWGKGSIILNCIPLAFSNIYAIKGDAAEFMSTSLSYLPDRDTYWSEFYSVGRMEASTPLRFILTREPLAWAYYLSIISLLIFMIFEAKRKQRIIPIIPPLQNTTLEFTGIIGNLYYQRGDHKNIAEKKILFLFDQIRTKHFLNPNDMSENFVLTLAKKSGKSETDVRKLFDLIREILKKPSIKEGELIELNRRIESFNEK